jgi:phosphatidylserine/phosphatidylglycerophosphate/cardiolipin synthase-like enzyme
VPAFETDLIIAGARPAADVAAELSEFISQAKRSLEVAIYDFQASQGASASVATALEAAASRGVAVRVAFNVERPRHVHPPPPKSTPQEIDGLSVPTRGVHSQGGLMHHKFVVRDRATVWTGSLNWTDDAFSLEENVIMRVESEPVAAAFVHDFEQLWSGHALERSGGTGPQAHADRVLVQPYFGPHGPSLAHLTAWRLGRAGRRIRVLSPVVTAGPILGTLAEFAGRQAFDFGGAYDRTQMHEVQTQWQAVPANHWKIEAWGVIAARLSGKPSTPYQEGSTHDYMHAKAIVIDSEVLAGSYNFSRGGEENAENMLRITDQWQADAFAAFADQVQQRYAG